MAKLFTIFILLICLTSAGQKTEKVIVFHEDPFDLNANIDKDSTTLFYDKMIPSGEPIGVLVILGGTFDLIPDIKNKLHFIVSLFKKTSWLFFLPLIMGQTNYFLSTNFLTQFSGK